MLTCWCPEGVEPFALFEGAEVDPHYRPEPPPAAPVSPSSSDAPPRPDPGGRWRHYSLEPGRKGLSPLPFPFFRGDPPPEDKGPYFYPFGGRPAHSPGGLPLPARPAPPGPALEILSSLAELRSKYAPGAPYFSPADVRVVDCGIEVDDSSGRVSIFVRCEFDGIEMTERASAGSIHVERIGGAAAWREQVEPQIIARLMAYAGAHRIGVRWPGHPDFPPGPGPPQSPS